MFYKVELICHHAPHQCRCRHNLATQVQHQDLTANLIKCNPALLKYLGRTTTTTITQPQINVVQPDTKKTVESDRQKQYRSIVQEKGLNFILRDNFVSQSNRPLSPKQPITQPQPQTTLPPQQQHNIDSNTQIPPKSPKQPKPNAESSHAKQVKDFHKDLKQQSRYLSNTAFRKYFDRQCFQNYGNQNVHDKADGFVYGNYLKTYNINPHSGQNMPPNEETFYHALVSASPQKYAIQTQEVKLGHTQKSAQKRLTEAEHSLERNKIDVEHMLQDNLKHSQLEKKYENIKLKTNKGTDTRKANTNIIRSQGKPTINTPNIISSQANPSQFSPKHQLPLQSRKILPAQHEHLTRTENEVTKKQQEGRLQSRAESIVVVQPIKPSKVDSPSHCHHQPGQESKDCECCLNQMKGLILTLAQNDPDLASRIVASAKKATIYKNFALNNYEQAAMNPHNYTNSGKLNIYRQ